MIPIRETPSLDAGSFVLISEGGEYRESVVLCGPGGAKSLLRKIRRRLAREGTRGRRGAKRIPIRDEPAYPSGSVFGGAR